MAAPPPQLSGVDRIRSLTDQDSVFKAFDAYPWTKDTAFLSGLHAILGEPNSTNPLGGSLRDMATHARVFYYAQRIGVHIDFIAYQSWLAQNPQHQPPDILPEGYETPPSSSSSSVPATAWQQAAPKADLYIDRSAAQSQSQSQSSSSSSSSPSAEPNYPIAFAEMIKLLQEGKPIPGIRQIPNTIERDPSVKPVGSRPVPRKPWEKDTPAPAPEVDGAKTLDLDFPSLEEPTEAS